MSDEDVKKHITSSDDWGASMFIMSKLSAIVKQFHFIAHENFSNTGDEVDGKQLAPTNHWSLFLTLNTSKISSVRVEVIPNEPGEPGTVIVESKGYAFTNNHTKTVSIGAPEGITVADVLSRKREITISSHLLERVAASGCILLRVTLLVPILSAQPTLLKFSQRSSCIGQSLRELLE